MGKTYFVEVTKYRQEIVHVKGAKNEEEALHDAIFMMPDTDSDDDSYSWDAEIIATGESDVSTEATKD